MRWFWIDRFVEFESGRRAVAIKNVSLVEEEMDRYVPGFPLMPSSLIVEGMAQTGGLLVAQHSDFKERVVLAKVARATFHRPALPGDTLRYTAVAQNIQTTGAMVTGTSHVGDELQAEIDLFFAHLDDRFDVGDLFEPYEFVTMLRSYGIFDIGKNEDGTPIKVPAHLLEAERAAIELEKG